MRAPPLSPHHPNQPASRPPADRLTACPPRAVSDELGVLVLPSLQPPGLRTLAAASSPAAAAAAAGAAAGAASPTTTIVPLPYSIPPVPYRPSDVPWSAARAAVEPSSCHAPDRHSRTPAYYWGENGKGSSYYGPHATGRLLAEASGRAAR